MDKNYNNIINNESNISNNNNHLFFKVNYKIENQNKQNKLNQKIKIILHNK